MIATHAADGDAHHDEAHTVASHSDTGATGAELETLTGGGSTALHSHAVAHSSTTGKGANDHHNESHSVSSHSDTSATGGELDELTDGSTTTLHGHTGWAVVLADNAEYTATGSISYSPLKSYAVSIPATSWIRCTFQ